MSRASRRTTPIATVLIAAALLLPVVAGAAPKNIDKVNGAITTEAGVEYGNLETVNGGISIAGGSRAKNVSTVNGGVVIGEQAELGSVETVNGGISIGAGSRVDGDVETVNGGISLSKDSEVNGGIETVNGGIKLDSARLNQGIETVNGDIEVLNGSVIKGGIVVRKPSGSWFNWGNQRTPKVVIGANSVVEGPLVFEREVELLVDASAKIGKVTGATAKTLEIEKAR